MVEDTNSYVGLLRLSDSSTISTHKNVVANIYNILPSLSSLCLLISFSNFSPERLNVLPLCST